MADPLKEAHGIVASRSAMPRSCQALGIRTYRPTDRSLRGDPVKQAQAREGRAEPREEAEAGESVMLSQDEARLPMGPTLGPTPGVKGRRPTVGTRDCKDLLDVRGVVDGVTGALHASTPASPARAKQKTGKSKTRRLQEAFAARLRPVARLDPRGEPQRVVLIIDSAPWHRGRPIAEALAAPPHPEVDRLPSSSRQLNVSERSWKLVRRRATPNRLFDRLATLKRSLRASRCDFQTMRKRMRRLIGGCYARPENQNVSVGV